MMTDDSNQFVSDTTTLNNYGKGWGVISSFFWMLLLVTVIYAVLRAPVDMIEGVEDLPPWVAAFALLYGIFIVGPITMSYGWVFLRAARKEDFGIKDLFFVFERNYWNAVGAGILVFIIVTLGLLLLVVPGIILACRLAFVGFLIIDQKMQVVESLRTSWAMTRGHGWSIFGMFLLSIPLIIAGLLALIVGVFISVMWIVAAFAVLYHSICRKEGIPAPGDALAPRVRH